MAREEFIDSLRHAFLFLLPPRVDSGQGEQTDAYISSRLRSLDLWLRPAAVKGFDPADFADWPKEKREKLAKEVAAFLAIAEKFQGNELPTKAQSMQARKHLEQVIDIVRRELLDEWLEAQRKMLEEAILGAKA